MEVILKEDIKGLGYKNDIVDVKPGYGRNYLIPQGFATLATDSAKKVLAENIKQAAHKEAKVKQDAVEMAAAIGELILEIPAKAGESGKIFGAVTAVQVSEALAEKGFNIDRKRIHFTADVKSVGEYEVELSLHKEVKHNIKLNVVAAQ